MERSPGREARNRIGLMAAGFGALGLGMVLLSGTGSSLAHWTSESFAGAVGEIGSAIISGGVIAGLFLQVEIRANEAVRKQDREIADEARTQELQVAERSRRQDRELAERQTRERYQLALGLEPMLVDRNLSGMDLSGIRLPGRILVRIVLTESDLFGANLRKADLSGSVMTKADLTGADLSDANLSKAKLSRAVLAGTDLSGADLTGADLSFARLFEENPRESAGLLQMPPDLFGIGDPRAAYLGGATISGTIFDRFGLGEELWSPEVAKIVRERMIGVKWDPANEPVWPPNFVPPGNAWDSDEDG